jgi:hypothetical protein
MPTSSAAVTILEKKLKPKTKEDRKGKGKATEVIDISDESGIDAEE